MRQVELVCAFLLKDALLTTFVDVCSVSMLLLENGSSPVEMARSLLVLLLLGLGTFSTDDSDDIQDKRLSIRGDDHVVVGDMHSFFVGEA
jgi:hypothetical protein